MHFGGDPIRFGTDPFSRGDNAGRLIEIRHSKEVCVPQIGKISARTLHYETIVFDKVEVVKNALPSKVRGESFVSINCSTADQKPSIEFDFVRRHSTTIATTHGIKNTIEANTKVTFNYAKAVGGEFGLRDAYEVQNSTSETTVDEDSEPRKVALPLVVPAMTNFVSQGWIADSTDRLLWHATAVLDGPVIPNKDGISYVSDVLPSAGRTLPLEGYIDDVHSTDIDNNYFSPKVTEAQCKDIMAKHLPMQYRVNYLLYPPDTGK